MRIDSTGKGSRADPGPWEDKKLREVEEPVKEMETEGAATEGVGGSQEEYELEAKSECASGAGGRPRPYCCRSKPSLSIGHELRPMINGAPKAMAAK